MTNTEYIEKCIKDGILSAKKTYDAQIATTQLKLITARWLKRMSVAAGLFLLDSTSGGMAKFILSESEISKIAHTNDEYMILDLYAGAAFWICVMAAGLLFRNAATLAIPKVSADKKDRRKEFSIEPFISLTLAAGLLLIAASLVFPLLSYGGYIGTAIAIGALLIDGCMLLDQDSIRFLIPVSKALSSRAENFRITDAVLEEVRRTNTYTEYVNDMPITIGIALEDTGINSQ